MRVDVSGCVRQVRGCVGVWVGQHGARTHLSAASLSLSLTHTHTHSHTTAHPHPPPPAHPGDDVGELGGVVKHHHIVVQGQVDVGQAAVVLGGLLKRQLACGGAGAGVRVCVCVCAGRMGADGGWEVDEHGR